MSTLVILSELLSPVGLTFLFLFLLLGGFVRREMSKMYIDRDNPSKYYTVKVCNTWKYLNLILLLIAILIFIGKIVIKYDEVQKRGTENIVKEKVIIEEPKIRLNEQVFYFCLNTAKSKEGLKATEINACKEAAIIDLASIEDKDKYTISKRDMVF